jgi:glutathione S-transferase
MSGTEIVFFHGPNSRSDGILFLLEELGVAYERRILWLDRADQKKPDYLAVNPMGKVPAIRVDGTIVTELGAIALHLGDLFPERGLSPRPGEAGRGEMLRWLFFYGNCFEPALCDRVMKREPGKPSMMPYGSFEDTWATILGRLGENEWIGGARFTVADTVWGSALSWTRAFGLLPEAPVVDAYVERIASRPAFRRAKEIDEALIAARG